MEIRNVKGSYDFLPNEQKIRNYINDTLKTVFEVYGYQPLETPILCYYDLLALKYDEENDILKEIYKLTDQGQRKLGLRYDLTVPFAKCIAISKNIKLPFKRYEIGKVFRDGPVKTGRDREFIQCDVDVVGITGQMIEAEIMALFIEGCNRLEIPCILKYNNRKLMSGIISFLNIKEELVTSVITIMDKIEKMPREELSKELKTLDLTDEVIEKLLNYFKLSYDEMLKEFKNVDIQLLQEGLEEIGVLKEYIKQLDIEDKTVFSPSLARGHEYYTGTVFEAFETTGKLNCSIGGGGRYDRMIKDFVDNGQEYPAVGISYGLTGLYELLKDREQFSNKSLLDIYIIPLNTKKEALKIAEQLRKLNLKIDIEMNDRKLKKCLDFANKENIPYTIIIGEDEISKKIIQLKDMVTGEAYNISLDNLEEINNIIKK